MVIDQEKLNYYNTDVSVIMYFLKLLQLWQLTTGTGEGLKLKKVQFGRIIDGKLMYESGESDFTVFEGLHNITSYVDLQLM